MLCAAYNNSVDKDKMRMRAPPHTHPDLTRKQTSERLNND